MSRKTNDRDKEKLAGTLKSGRKVRNSTFVKSMEKESRTEKTNR